jgi:hypothetical protein
MAFKIVISPKARIDILMVLGVICTHRDPKIGEERITNNTD